MLVGDAMGRAMLALQNDVTPPSPTPAKDPSAPVEYYFENTSNATNSGWISSGSWNNTGLTNGVSYNFRVKARDAEGNETDWSATISASPGPDVTAHSPDPVSFAGPPEALGEDSIAMNATSALDVNGVEYYFECTVGGTAVERLFVIVEATQN